MSKHKIECGCDTCDKVWEDHLNELLKRLEDEEEVRSTSLPPSYRVGGAPPVIKGRVMRKDIDKKDTWEYSSLEEWDD